MNLSRRPSAALVLGVLAGCFAALAILPTAVPLSWRLADLEEGVALRHAQHATTVVATMLTEDAVLQPGLRQQLGVGHVEVRTVDALVLHAEGPGLPANAFTLTCPSGTHVARDHGLALACTRTEAWSAVSAVPITRTPGPDTLYLVFALAGIVGIVTALGVLRLLNPISRVSRAVARVGAGERGVRVASAGLVELDELVDRLNEAASAMEAREDAIVARIQVVQDMARMVAHEVRNPLQSLELLTSLVAAEDDPKERVELARSIHAEIRALDMVVTRVLREGTAGRGLRLARGNQALGPLIDQVLAVRSAEARVHGVKLERGPIAERPAYLDGALVGRSIENLVLNALQAVPPRRGHIRISAWEDGAHLAIAVDDNGPGVDPELAPHIFEANVTGRTGGTGLGLALVREVMVAHGGYVVHERSPLGGARFVARIPFEEAPGGQEATGTDR